MSISALMWPFLVGFLVAQQERPATIDADQVCSHPQGFVAPCLTVHGRLSLYSDNVPLRIWPLGSSRLLGVQTADSPFYLPVACRVPSELTRGLDLDTDI